MVWLVVQSVAHDITVVLLLLLLHSVLRWKNIYDRRHNTRADLYKNCNDVFAVRFAITSEALNNFIHSTTEHWSIFFLLYL